MKQGSSTIWRRSIKQHNGMLKSLKRSLQAARSFEAVQDAAAAALPGLERARGLDRSELAELATLYTGGTPL